MQEEIKSIIIIGTICKETGSLFLEVTMSHSERTRGGSGPHRS